MRETDQVPSTDGKPELNPNVGTGGAAGAGCGEDGGEVCAAGAMTAGAAGAGAGRAATTVGGALGFRAGSFGIVVTFFRVILTADLLFFLTCLAALLAAGFFLPTFFFAAGLRTRRFLATFFLAAFFFAMGRFSEFGKGHAVPQLPQCNHSQSDYR